MKASDIRVGAILRYTAGARRRYGLTGETVTVMSLTYRDGYKTPFVHCAYENGVGAFRPVDFAREVRA